MTSKHYRSAIAHLLERIERLNAIGVALSAERDPVRLLEQILLGAKALTNADAGSIYSVTDDRQVRFEIVRTASLGLQFGGSSATPVPFAPIPLYGADGQPNSHSVVAHCVLSGAPVNIPDAYHADGFDFSGTRAFDANTGYHSTSLLTVPMRNHDGVIVGVLQLLNAQNADGEVVPFSTPDQRLVESLASQAATALTKRELIEGMRELFEAFIRLIATAIDEKSPYTADHCRRVPELTLLLADAAAHATSGPLAGFSMSAADRYELSIAAWLHDCGKITTPEAVMDKATKLSRIGDRIELVALRFELAKRETRIAVLEARMTIGEAQSCDAQIDDDLIFLRRANTGSERMADADIARVNTIATRRLADGSPLLTDDEVRNLTIVKGTLLPEERAVINHHIVATIKMLESLPYPRHLRRVPEFAGGHHERMDGRGYPKGLKRAQMSVQARIMGIADIFEALTAGDRPYKRAMTLREALDILGKMSLDGHIDPDLFQVFVGAGVWREYAQRCLKPEQIDAVDLAAIPGFFGATS